LATAHATKARRATKLCIVFVVFCCDGNFAGRELLQTLAMKMGIKYMLSTYLQSLDFERVLWAWFSDSMAG